MSNDLFRLSSLNAHVDAHELPHQHVDHRNDADEPPLSSFPSQSMESGAKVPSAHVRW